MFQKRWFNRISGSGLILLINASNSWAQMNFGGGGSVQDVNGAATDFSNKILTIFKGPLIKVVAGVILFVGVGGLLRGKHHVAVSCGIAFILLLCLPIILRYFGG